MISCTEWAVVHGMHIITIQKCNNNKKNIETWTMRARKNWLCYMWVMSQVKWFNIEPETHANGRMCELSLALNYIIIWSFWVAYSPLYLFLISFACHTHTHTLVHHEFATNFIPKQLVVAVIVSGLRWFQFAMPLTCSWSVKFLCAEKLQNELA